MTEQSIKIEYKKLNAFLKDYIKMLNRGWVFLLINNDYPVGKEIKFSIKVKGLDEEIHAVGEVAYKGLNDNGNTGTGLLFSFDKTSADYLKSSLNSIIIQSYGEYWGTHICSVFQEN